jgi:hypothetical protein
MNSMSLRTLLASCGLLAGTAVATPAELTPQKGAAALIVMLDVRDELPRELDMLTFASSDLVDRALRLLAPATTLAQVMASPSGVSVACPVSGSVTARMSPRAPRLLKLQWTGCATDTEGLMHTLDGLGEVALLDATFAPPAVASISLGDRNGALVDQAAYLGSEQPPDVNSFNLRMTGYIRLARAAVIDPFKGTSLYELSGSRAIRSSFLAGDGESPDQLFESVYSVSVDHMVVHRTLQDAETELGVLGGKLSFVWDFPETPQEAAHVDRYTIEPTGFRLRDRTSLTTFDRTLEVDGSVRITMPDFLPFFACYYNVDFSYRTTVPLHYAVSGAGSEVFDAGEISMNGTPAHFSYAPGADATHVAFDTSTGGFSHDVSSDQGRWVSLFGPAACPR